jgi:hypothetical protein
MLAEAEHRLYGEDRLAGAPILSTSYRLLLTWPALSYGRQWRAHIKRAICVLSFPEKHMQDFTSLVLNVHSAHAMARSGGTRECLAEADARRLVTSEAMAALRSTVSDAQYMEMRTTIDALKDMRDLIEREYVEGGRRQ